MLVTLRRVPRMGNHCIPVGSILVPPVCPDTKHESGVTKDEHINFEFTNWLHDMAPWDLIFTGTFEWESSLQATRKAFQKFMSKNCPGVTYFFVSEKNPSRPGYHIHALLCNATGLYRKGVWALWKKKYGMNRLEPIRSRLDVEKYTTKHCVTYLTKGVGDYDFQINDPELWHKNKK